ncbi:MAG: hypothetical protein KFB95_00245 [Simkaniaceae bacterium]|nr:MAG: hypothetical protein KFB95_00245 [Simkaniaceae bacterium]
MDLSLQSINLNKAQTPSQGVKNDANFSDKTSQKTDNIVVKFFKWAGLTLKLKSLERQEKKLMSAMAQDALSPNTGKNFRDAYAKLGPVHNEIARLKPVLADYWRT